MHAVGKPLHTPGAKGALGSQGPVWPELARGLRATTARVAWHITTTLGLALVP